MRILKDESLYIQNILMGEFLTNPIYIKQEVEDYSNNPFIEALPSIFTDNEVAKRFMIYPHWDEEEKNKNIEIRYHMIKRLKNFVQPLNIHFKIERRISIMIRRGYIARNPYSKEYLQRLRLINDIKIEKGTDILKSINQINSTLRSTADSFSIIGISGIGKTTAIERLLQMYPQVIMHHEYKGKAMTRTQVVWLKLDCPYDGSIKTLCKMFFKAIDNVLGITNYFDKYGNNRNSTATMMIHMTYLASVYAIGVLVIDEIQHLINVKNSPDEMLNFFVTLVNTIGVPTILIGTPKACKVLSKDFRQARRAEGEGGIVWDRMRNDDEWTFFIETMWKFQWIKKTTPLNEELKNAMYYESQGITAIAVSLFILVQERAIFSNSEKITLELIEKVARDDLKLIQDMIKALKNNDINKIAKYEDIYINLDCILDNYKHQIDLRERVKNVYSEQKSMLQQKREEVKNEVISDILAMKIINNLTYNKVLSIADDIIKGLGGNYDSSKVKRLIIKRILDDEEKKEIKIDSDKEKILLKNDLRSIFEVSRKSKESIYQLLKQLNYIKDPLKELLF